MATIPINDLKRVFAEQSPDFIQALQVVLESGWWLNGSQTKSFCEAFASYIGVNDCLAVANGTDALEIAMRAIIAARTQPGTEVITVANAGGYSSVACRLVGLTPVYADIEEASQLVSLESVMAAVCQKTALIVVTHLYGGVVDVPRLRSLLDDAGYGNVPIVEDCAQSHGVKLGKCVAGSMGNIATFSFYPTKNLGAFGDGGAIASSDPRLMNRCRQLHQYGWSSKYTIGVAQGRNSRIDEVQAAFLNKLLPGLDKANERRVAILDRYEKECRHGVRVVRSEKGTVAHLAVVLCEERDQLRNHLARHNIQSDIHYPILDCDQAGWKTLPQRLSPTGIPVSRTSVSQLVTLPCFPNLTDGEIAQIGNALRAWER